MTISSIVFKKQCVCVCVWGGGGGGAFDAPLSPGTVKNAQSE